MYWAIPSLLYLFSSFQTINSSIDSSHIPLTTIFERASRNTENESNQLLLGDGIYSGHDIRIFAEPFSIIGSTKVTISYASEGLPNPGEAENMNGQPRQPYMWKCIFNIQNSTLHFTSFIASLWEPRSMNHHLGTSKESLPRFAVIQEADITAKSIIFLQEADHSPFVITTSLPQSSSTLTLVACTVNRTYPLIGSFSEIDFPKSSSLSADIVISSLSLTSSEVVGTNGLASSTSSPQSHLSLCASLLSCELFNLTSGPSQTTRQSQTITKQKLAHCHFSSVDNALYGAAISRIDHSSSSLCLNTSIVDCLNLNNEPTTINENKTITGTADRYAYHAQSGSFLFSLCNLTTNTPTQETSLIFFSAFSGTLEINGCSFTSKVGAYHATSVNVEAITETFPKITLISSNFTFSRISNTPNDESQINTVRPLQLNVINCIFTTPAEDVYSNTRAIQNRQAITFVQIAHCRFLRQSTSGSGGALSYYNGVHLIHIFDTLFEANKAASEGGSLSLYTAHHKCFRSVFKDCSAGKLGGAIKLYWPYHSYHEDCAFINNNANQTDNLNNLASYRGNDIQIRTRVFQNYP
ncbi:hypothetical protein BLNAU_15850 [Blattamonas nauphoetae]|uniref:Uncharacterized protein n=1 Tax=Blattamonas nauphoetae TaxID=2049346 RepID=A0ABQ9XD78_9EUKA|nr:hypothetical protein BLNAU_15850 [Blattamonas nauphoetae]